MQRRTNVRQRLKFNPESEDTLGRAFSRIAGWLVILVALVILSSWRNLNFLQAVPSAPQATPITAIMLLALGIALIISQLILTRRLTRRSVYLCWVFVAMALVIDLWVALNYLFNLPSTI